MTGLDATAQLALAAKAMSVFAPLVETFLSFPIETPLTFQADQLDMVNIGSADHLQSAADLARILNARPVPGVFALSADRLLWDAYREVLRDASLAEGTLSPADAAALAAVKAVLYVQGADGLREPSDALVAYNQARAAWLAATQAYASAKQTTAASTDPAVQAQWANKDEPSLRAAVAAAEQQWETVGCKAAVEAARVTEAAYAARSPALQWAEWAQQFRPELDMMTDGQGASFAITGFCPADFWRQPRWTTLTLTAAEIASLARQAPPALRDAFDNPTGASAIVSVTLEYCSITVERPWFHPELFAARFWRLPEGTPPLSDGNASPAGSFGAYVAAVVFVRNVIPVASTPSSGEPPQSQSPTHPTVPVIFGPKRVHLPGPGLGTGIHPVAVPVPEGTASLRPTVPMHGLVSTTTPVRPVADSLTTATGFKPLVVSRLQMLARPLVPSVSPPQPQPSDEGQPSTDPRISVLAFICKPFPKAPNPDPAFQWSASPVPSRSS